MKRRTLTVISGLLAIAVIAFLSGVFITAPAGTAEAAGPPGQTVDNGFMETFTGERSVELQVFCLEGEAFLLGVARGGVHAGGGGVAISEGPSTLCVR